MSILCFFIFFGPNEKEHTNEICTARLPMGRNRLQIHNDNIPMPTMDDFTDILTNSSSVAATRSIQVRDPKQKDVPIICRARIASMDTLLLVKSPTNDFFLLLHLVLGRCVVSTWWSCVSVRFGRTFRVSEIAKSMIW